MERSSGEQRIHNSITRDAPHDSRCVECTDLKDDNLERIVSFIREIGLNIEPASLSGDMFLPGITIDHGTLLFDPVKLGHAGDLLHEAGHLAVIPEEERAKLTGNVGEAPGAEMAAIAWSYAAAIKLGLPPEVVFHSEGYAGGSQSILENFANGRFFGVPWLEWRGLTSTKEDADVRFPEMLQWICP